MVNLSDTKMRSAMLQLLCSKNTRKNCCCVFCSEFSNISVFISHLLYGIT